MKRTIIFITGTDTGAGKTVLTALLAQFLHERGVSVAALKPICSGGREDARKIFAATSGILSLNEINPWHFCAPIAPLLAARQENQRLKLPQVLAHIREMQERFDFLAVEGAGGLLSPLGENFNSRDLILRLSATPIVVAQNKLGVVNQILLTLETLPENFRRKAKIVLMSPQKPDVSTRTNAKLLAEFFSAKQILSLPWLGKTIQPNRILKNPRVWRTLRDLAKV